MCYNACSYFVFFLVLEFLGIEARAYADHQAGAVTVHIQLMFIAEWERWLWKEKDRSSEREYALAGTSAMSAATSGLPICAWKRLPAHRIAFPVFCTQGALQVPVSFSICKNCPFTGGSQ